MNRTSLAATFILLVGLSPGAASATQPGSRTVRRQTPSSNFVQIGSRYYLRRLDDPTRFEQKSGETVALAKRLLGDPMVGRIVSPADADARVAKVGGILYLVGRTGLKPLSGAGSRRAASPWR